MEPEDDEDDDDDVPAAAAPAPRVCVIGLSINADFGYCDTSVREKDWRCPSVERRRREPTGAISPGCGATPLSVCAHEHMRARAPPPPDTLLL